MPHYFFFPSYSLKGGIIYLMLWKKNRSQINESRRLVMGTKTLLWMSVLTFTWLKKKSNIIFNLKRNFASSIIHLNYVELLSLRVQSSSLPRERSLNCRIISWYIWKEMLYIWFNQKIIKMTLSDLSDKKNNLFEIGHQTKIIQWNSIITRKKILISTPSFYKYWLTKYLLKHAMG